MPATERAVAVDLDSAREELSVMLAGQLRLPLVLAALVALSFTSAACEDTPTSPSSYAPFSKTDLVVGTGDEVVLGDVVSVHYTGWIYDATKTDQKGALFGTSRGSDPFEVSISEDALIAGWVQGVPGMKEGGMRRLVVPPSLAYGSSRTGPIPPYATLVFEIELLDIVE